MSTTKGLLIVLLIGVTGISLTLGVQRLTARSAALEQQNLQRRTLLAILPSASYDNQPLQQPLAMTPQELEHSQLLGGYLAMLAGRPNAVLLRSQASGYGGTLELLIAISDNGTLLGVKPLKHSETPSLGGRIAEDHNPWIAALQGQSRRTRQDSAWALKKDHGQFDQIAGATITSRAVISAVHDALRYFDEHRQALLDSPAHD